MTDHTDHPVVDDFADDFPNGLAVMDERGLLVDFVAKVRRRCEVAAADRQHHLPWFNNLLARLGSPPLPMEAMGDTEWRVDVPVYDAYARIHVMADGPEAAYEAARQRYDDDRHDDRAAWPSTFESIDFDNAVTTRLAGGLPYAPPKLVDLADLPTTREQARQIVREEILEAMLDTKDSPNFCEGGVRPHWRALRLGDLPTFSQYRFEFPAGPYRAVIYARGYDAPSARRVAAHHLGRSGESDRVTYLTVEVPTADLDIATAPYTISTKPDRDREAVAVISAA